MFRREIYEIFMLVFILFLVGCAESNISEKVEDDTNLDEQGEEVVAEKEATEPSTKTESKTKQSDNVITVKRQEDDDNKYEEYQEITGNKLTEVVNAFETLEWELGVIDLLHSPKYQLDFKLSDVERKTYLLYVNSDRSGFTLVKENGARYVTLDDQNSASKIYKMFTGEDLTVAKQ